MDLHRLSVQKENEMTTEHMISVMQAFTRGEKIEVSHTDCSIWVASPEPSWNFVAFDYRIAKPEPKRIKLLAFIDDQGYVRFVKEEKFFERKPPFTRLPDLDREVELP